MGGGGKGGTTTQTVSIPPEVLARYNAVNARAEGVAARPFQQYGTTAEAFVAPLTSTQQAGIAGTNVAAGMAQPFYGAATGLTMGGAQGVGPLTQQQIGYYQNPFTQSVVDPTVKALQQEFGQQRAQQQASAIRSGAFGGDRSGLERANLIRQQGLGMAQAIAPLYAQGYQTGVQTAAGQQGVIASDLQRQLAAGQQLAGLGTGAQAAALQGAQAQLGAGQIQQQTEQAGKAALYNQFLQEQGYPFQVAQFLANIAMGTGALSGSTTATTQPGGFFSDRRLKEDIKKVGETFDGQPIYTYKYKGEDTTRMGLMAQDVEKRHPEAVGKSQGYKTVNYDKATENSEGGAVTPERSGLGFAAGGSAGFDQDMIRELLKSQQQQYGMYGAPGTPLGAQGTPGGPSRVPQASLPVGKLATPAAPPRQQESGISQAAQIGKTVSGLASGAKEAKRDLFGGADEKGTYQKGALQSRDKFIEAAGKHASERAAQARDIEEARKRYESTPVKDVKVEGAPRADLGTEAPTQMAEGLGAAAEPATAVAEALPKEELLSLFAARGGRIGYEEGGDVEEPISAYKTPGLGLDIPDESKKHELMTAKGAPPSGGGGGVGVGDAVKIAATVLPMIFSDKRMKENIVPIGKTYDGQTVYKYNYKGEPEAQIGLIAQEVEKRRPGAVHEIDGMKAIDYARAVRNKKALGGPEEVDPTLASDISQPLSEEERSRPVDMSYAARTGDYTGLPFASSTAVQPAAPIERPSGLAPRVEQTPTTNTGFALGKVSTDMPPPAPLVSPADAQAPAPVAGLGAAPTAPAAPAPAPVAPATEPAAAAPAPASAPAAGLAAAPAVAAPQQVGASNFAYSLNRTFQFEGGLNRADTNGQPSLYGINKQYHPDFFENPTKENAAKIYYEQYWKGVGADKMDPKLAHVAFDTAVIAGVDRTRRLLEQAGGDPYKLLELRKQFTDSLIARDPDKYGKYAKAWDNRVRTLASDISGEGGMPTQFAGIGAGGAGLPQPGERQGLAAALPSEQRASPFRTLAEGSFPNMPEALKSEKLVVPLLGGLAAMLASNKPNLGQALGEGLAGALSAYSDMYTRAPQVEGIEAGTERTRVETNAASFFTDREGRGRVTYRAPDGSVRTIDLAEWIGLKDKPPLDARSERLAREYAESKGIPFSPSGTGLGAAVTPAAAGTTTAAPTGGLGTAVPLPAAPYIALPTEIASDGQRRARELFSAGTSAVASLPGADLMKQQTEAAKAAQDIRPKQATLATSISALPLNGSLLTPGEPARILAPVAAAMNGLLTAAGGQPFVDPADLASKEGIDKIKNQLAQTASSAAGQRAYQAFSEILAAIPSNINSREGAARLLGELYVVNQREIDRENFFRQYRDSAAGPNGAYRLQANALGGEAEAAFNRIYPPERYNEEKAAIVRMMQTSPGNAPMNEAGRPMSWLEYMHKYGSTLSAEQRAAVRNTFSKESPDVLRFFGIGS